MGFPAWVLLLGLSLSSCVMVARRPCTRGGEPAHADGVRRGTTQCYQAKNSEGVFVNHGIYREYYASGKVALEGEYYLGSKHGKWIEWDESGKKLSERWFDHGVETPTRESASLKTQALSVPANPTGK